MIVYMNPKSLTKARSVDLQPQMTLATLLNPQNLKAFFPASVITNPSSSSPKLSSLKFPRRVLSFCYADDDHVLGDCVVFEEGVFEDPYLRSNFNVVKDSSSVTKKPKSKKTVVPEVQRQNLVPDHWTEVLAEIHMTKKERRKIAQEMEFNSRLEKKRRALAPIRSVNLEEYKAYREAKLAQLKPLVLDNPTTFPVKDEEDEDDEVKENSAERVSPKNPRWAVYGKNFDDVTEFFNSGQYVPGKSEARRKLFTKDEKTLLNRKIPHLEPATSRKWLPLHTLAASGEFYLTNILLKHKVDINAVDLDGWTALHKAVISKKQAITTYLLRESASPFVRDTDGATLMHYAVQTASSPAIKLLLLYNVDVNLQDDDGWTPLHLAVQAQRTDIVKLLLIKGADKTVRNKDGLTPLELCLYCGRGTRTYELIKLLKQFPRKSTAFVETSSPKLLAS